MFLEFDNGLFRKKRVWILYANTRYIHGNWIFSTPSRFLKELPKKNILTTNLFFDSESNKGMLIKNKNAIAYEDSQKIEDVFFSIRLLL